MFDKLIKEAHDYAALGRKLAENVAAGASVMTATQLAEVKAILDPLHEKNMALSQDLDAALAKAEKA